MLNLIEGLTNRTSVNIKINIDNKTIDTTKLKKRTKKLLLENNVYITGL